MGSIRRHSIFFLSKKGLWMFQITIYGGLFEILRMFYPTKGAAKAVPYGVHLTSFLFNNRTGNDFDTSKIPFSGGFFFVENVLFTDGVGWMGRNTKSVLQFYLHFVDI